LTLGNGICGFAAIAYASKITGSLSPSDINSYFLLSAALIYLAMVFDALDGAAARLSRTASEFGGQLDSLCDAISFGVAPAILLLRLGQEWPSSTTLTGKAISVIAALYVACAILRLARFNTENTTDPASHKRFKGLPSPAAAGCLASLVVLRCELPHTMTGINDEILKEFVKMVAPAAAAVLALLMVSRISYPHFTHQLLRGRRRFGFVVQVVFVAAIVALAPELACFVLFWFYALSGPVRSVLYQRRRQPVATQTPRAD
jgi:CDP-diacylglycerol--serine O-phosphatidyltransferase